MILSNRIDHGSEAGGLISSKQFDQLIADLMCWRDVSITEGLAAACGRAALIARFASGTEPKPRMGDSLTPSWAAPEPGRCSVHIQPAKAAEQVLPWPGCRLMRATGLPASVPIHT